MKKSLFIFLAICISHVSIGQKQTELSKWTFGFSISPDDYRYAKAEKSGLYYQFAFDRHLTDHLILGAYLGIQDRYQSFTSEYPIPPYTVKEIEYERRYIPLGIRFGFDFTSYFSNQLNWIKNESKWEILLLGYGGLTIQSTDFLTSIDSGEAVEWSEYSMEEDMNYVAGVNAVIRYFPTKNWGINTEVGYGPVGRYSFGMVYRIR